MNSAGKYRITQIGKKGSRRVSWMNERQLERFRAKRLQAIRKKELGLTQKVLAGAIGANLRTLQDWELGRSPMPKPVETLLNLMREMPSVRKKLLAAHS